MLLCPRWSSALGSAAAVLPEIPHLADTLGPRVVKLLELGGVLLALLHEQMPVAVGSCVCHVELPRDSAVVAPATGQPSLHRSVCRIIGQPDELATLVIWIRSEAPLAPAREEALPALLAILGSASLEGRGSRKLRLDRDDSDDSRHKTSSRSY